ncbi:hypothetical protein [Candidatus Nanohalobium constans]|uniref:Uncharacterized protein n=1 Tax=Candidatus Nanohalobium constans TaxID=2565781 RepID=A0A5Q0UHT1_9ARCH|nr:hypothetical protein [Candidatus Nanohalobium constans]QGA80449.1 hypothetical protein LC1Nh_0551 [Candidatus Nanohalobium constans]
MEVTVSKVLAWLTGGFFLLVGLMEFIYGLILLSLSNMFAGLIALVVAVVVTPKSRQMIRERYDLEFSRWLLIGVAITGLVLTTVLGGISSKTAEAPAQGDEMNFTEVLDQTVNLSEKNYSISELSDTGNVDDRYMGNIYRLEGRIIESYPEKTEPGVILEVHDGMNDHSFWLNEHGDLREDDVATVWANFTGEREYTIETVYGLVEAEKTSLDVLAVNVTCPAEVDYEDC